MRKRHNVPYKEITSSARVHVKMRRERVYRKKVY